MKPILFSTEMVRAILDGRKTQTRRVIKRGNVLPSGEWLGEIREGGSWCTNPRSDVIWTGFRSEYGADSYFMCYGKPGDILWVREIWCKLWALDIDDVPIDGTEKFYYAADGYNPTPFNRFPDADGYNGGRDCPRWRPSVHMPREAARLFLRVTGVRVERLQDISEDDARAEGVQVIGCPEYWMEFAALWDSFYTKRDYDWDTNPWVEVIEFERYTP